MKLRVAILVSLSALFLAACGGRATRTVELPGGAAPEQRQSVRQEPNFIDRLLGNDPRPNAGPCPVMAVLYDSARLVQFNDPAQERYANIEYTGEMRGVRGLCRYAGEDPITLSMDIDMAFGRGPAATSEQRTYRYWVAVTRRGRAPIEKEYFDVDVRFPSGEAVVTHTEQIEQIVIPRATATTSGENFEILVGFDLTPQQLAFNRDGKRFRIDAGAQAAQQN